MFNSIFYHSFYNVIFRGYYPHKIKFCCYREISSWSCGIDNEPSAGGNPFTIVYALEVDGMSDVWKVHEQIKDKFTDDLRKDAACIAAWNERTAIYAVLDYFLF